MLKMVDFFKAQDLTQVPLNTLYVDVMYGFCVSCLHVQHG